MTDRQPVTIVTVVFEIELPLLVLQARSLRLHVPTDQVARFLIIDNTANGISARDRSRIVRELGAHAAGMQILRQSDITPTPSAKGWIIQQILKLAISDLVETPAYVVLDAKNHFVRAPSAEFFVAADGRPCVNTYSYETHPLRPALERVLAYVGLDDPSLVDSFTATVTPFVFDTERVRRTMREVEERSGSRFAEEFVRADLTEFFLYTAWALRDGAGIEDLFHVQQVFCPVIWPGRNAASNVEDAGRALEDTRVPIFSAHRNALADMSPAAIAALATLWIGHGLFTSEQEARRFLRWFRINRLVHGAAVRVRTKLSSTGQRA